MTRRRKPGFALSRESINRLVDLHPPWEVVELEVVHEEREVRVHIAPDGKERLACPECGCTCSGYDHRERRWRHLDTMEYRTYRVCDVPRVRCPEHGVMTVKVPGSESISRFTNRFEAMGIDWLKEANVLAVHRLLGVSWNAIYGIKARAVLRGLSRREDCKPVHVCVDETSFRKRHDDVTVVSDFTTGTVHFVGDGRRKGTRSGWYKGLSEEQLGSVESVSMDMWPASINATLKHVPGAGDKIAFDKFHVRKKMKEAVAKVRRLEHKALFKEGRNDLKGTRFDGLTHHANMPEGQRRRFRQLRNSSLKTARAWASKELGMSLWKYVCRGWSGKRGNAGWVGRCGVVLNR